MKKIIASLAMIALVGALVIGATRAIFFDTETSFDNTFSAGTLDLKVNGEEDGATLSHIELSDMKPGDGVGGAEHSTIQYYYTLSNTGSLPGKPWIEIVNLVDKDNGCNEPEADAPASDISCGDPGDSEGELSQYLMMKINAPGNTGFVYPHCPGGGDYGSQCSLAYWASAGPIGGPVGLGENWEQVPAGGSTAPMVLEFEIPESVGNIIQSDSVEFDIVFHLDQI